MASMARTLTLRAGTLLALLSVCFLALPGSLFADPAGTPATQVVAGKADCDVQPYEEVCDDLYAVPLEDMRRAVLASKKLELAEKALEEANARNQSTIDEYATLHKAFETAVRQRNTATIVAVLTGALAVVSTSTLAIAWIVGRL